MTIKVQFNQSVSVRAEYLKHYTSGTFYHCLRFQQNGKNINLSVVFSYDIEFCIRYIVLHINSNFLNSSLFKKL